MICPVCDKDFTNMMWHFLSKHNRKCFCDAGKFSPFRTGPGLEKHWRERGGFERHWLEYLMNVHEEPGK